MTTQQAILAGAAVIGLALVVARLATPYQIVSPHPTTAWRVNVITGDVRLCSFNAGNELQCRESR